MEGSLFSLPNEGEEHWGGRGGIQPFFYIQLFFHDFPFFICLFLTRHAPDGGEHVLHGSGGHPGLRRGAHHGVRLARPGVPVREDG